CTFRLGGAKKLEDVDVRWNSFAGINNLDAHLFIGSVRLCGQRSPAGHRLASVLYQVEKCLLEPIGIAVNNRQIAGALLHNLDFLLQTFRHHQCSKFMHQSGQVDRLKGEPLRMRSGLEVRSEEHTSELQSRSDIVCRLRTEKKNLSSGVARCL